MSIMEYLGRLKGIADQLGVAGYVVSDKEKVQQTLSGLGQDFYAFTTALEVLPILPTFNELQGKLLQHEMNMQQLMRGTNQEMMCLRVKIKRDQYNHRMWPKVKIKRVQHCHQAITKAIMKNRATIHIGFRVLPTIDD
ncbi:hypothetical protein EJ110_NYTH38327 [Nymphaea thermarum]|nr:hypothetical protein EJ110_NYTH38327 [Nymphaea thermarum]